MGSQQSSREGSSAAISKTCYYELLGVDRLASDIDIKKAYRKRALDLHPDRNLDNVETATRKFSEVQSAYEVLADPHERAWYDSHRESILTGQDNGDEGFRPTTFNNVRLTSTEEVVRLMRMFNAAMLFNDEPTGFFGLARETFEHLSLEEEAATEVDGTEYPRYPTFGSSSDGYDSIVKPFYSIWGGFATSKSFSWKDKYRLSDAPDRRTRRLMERENKKCRDDAIRDFNDAVKFLVVFVRKRDPRYAPNFQTDADRQSSLRVAAAAQAARSRAVNQQKLGSSYLPDWSRSRDEGTEQDLFPELDEDDVVEIFECIVCNKTFKSEKQLEAHERSKKHIKSVHLLRRQMQREGIDLVLDPQNLSLDSDEKNSRETIDQSDTPSHVSDSDLHYTKNLGGNGLYKSQLPPVGTTPESSGELGERGGDEANEIVLESLANDTSDSESLHFPSPALVEDILSNSVQTMSLGSPKPTRKVGKAKMRKQKRVTKKDQGDEHCCSVCGGLFASRTKLFRHIREAGHAAPMSINEKEAH